MSAFPELGLTLVVVAAAVFLLAGLVKGVVGLGLPTVAMGLLALVVAPAAAAAMLIVPSVVTNVWQMRPWPRAVPLMRRLAPMQAGVVAGTLGGAAWLGPPAGTSALLGLGLALIAYAGWSLLGARLRVPHGAQRWAGPLVGVITGVVTAATGVFAIPAVPYLQAIDLERDDLIQAMGLSFTVSTLALAGGLASQGSYSGAMAMLSLMMLVPALVGMQLGQALRQRLSPQAFRLGFLSALLLLGLHLVWQGWPAA